MGSCDCKVKKEPGYPNYQIGDLVYVKKDIKSCGVIVGKVNAGGNSNIYGVNVIGHPVLIQVDEAHLRNATNYEKEQYEICYPDVKFNN